MEILPIAVKFVSWDVSPLDTLKNSRAYMLREKLNRNGKMDRAEKIGLQKMYETILISVPPSP